jgi:hypothetical protein
MMGAVLALGLTQITAWGTSYYCRGVLADPISLVSCGASCLAMELMSRWYERQQVAVATADRHGPPVRAARVP